MAPQALLVRTENALSIKVAMTWNGFSYVLINIATVKQFRRYTDKPLALCVTETPHYCLNIYPIYWSFLVLTI